ncbi:Orotidine 5'-phosphate decarboxylase [Ramicandelaber brevisporus]|nr:Orotidine 5'-phosphate decarboxylase [Ramicandelaber brevisporus]
MSQTASSFLKLSYGARAAAGAASGRMNPVARALLETMERKQSNLCLSADVTTTAELLAIADKVGPYICLLKTHIDIVDDFTVEGTASKLTELAEKHDFLIFEDRKFADIGNTVKHQYVNGVFRIASWAHIVNAHPLPGEGIVTGLRAGAIQQSGSADKLDRALLLLADMSTSDSLFTPEYTRKSVEMAVRNSDFVVGFISNGSLSKLVDEASTAANAGHRDFICMTPGVGLDASKDGMGQQYRTPDQIVRANGSDIIIVGRGIYGPGKDAAAEAKRYREAGWAAYQARLV